MSNISYKSLNKKEINLSLFTNFDRYQELKKCWRKEDKEWVLKDISFTEQWDPEDYNCNYLIEILKKNTKKIITSP